MNKEEIKVLLHHREPYLMVDKVISLDEKRIETIRTVSMDEGFIQGHFPGAPVVPGAMLQEMCTQSGGILITKLYSPEDNYHSEKTKGHALGVLKEVHSAKYHSITKPEKEISIKLELIKRRKSRFVFKAEVFQEENLKAQLEFTLVNIPDEILHK